MAKRKNVLTRRALRVEQHRDHPLYLFTLSGQEILAIADISRISRDAGGRLIGYQRPEVRRHIQDIATYLNEPEIVFPNSIIIALSTDVRFRRSRGPSVSDGDATSGNLEIPLPSSGDPKPGWIVDGQQRVMALNKSRRSDFPVPVSAFVADDVDLQRDQFLRINNTKPLPRGLVTELLPEVSAPLPRKLAAKKIPSALCDLLNRNPESPFHGLIRRASSSAEERRRAVITDTSVVKMLQESLTIPSGCLFPYRNIATGETDFEGIWDLLITYWGAVRRVFRDAWGKPTTRSRLMHGVGIRAMGRLMDRIMSTFDPRSEGATERVLAEVELVAPYCRWTAGRWAESRRHGLGRPAECAQAHPHALERSGSRLCGGEQEGGVRFFFPDSQDQIDPSFDFDTEQWSPHRVRQRDDRYAHEVLEEPAYTGLLVSKAVVDGAGTNSGRYTLAQRHRLYRQGVRRFFRLDRSRGPRLDTMGDCGAFTYVREAEPPISVDEVIDFYEGCGFDLGVSIDHVILGYDAKLDNGALPGLKPTPQEWRDRQAMTLDLAADFLSRCEVRRCAFEPVGVAQGWSPLSYAATVEELQRMGYSRIALGGLVPLKSPDILDTLRAVDAIRAGKTRLHLFGVTRCEHVNQFASYGVTSFDSTSPFRRAFKDDRNNYYTPEKDYVAIRVPQVEKNNKLKKRIRAGEVDQRLAIENEQRCLETLRRFDHDEADVDAVVQALRSYQAIYDGKRDRSAEYRELLEARPWRRCDCTICRRIGIQVVIFRGSERNKRRGFHNLYVFNQRLQSELNGRRPSTAMALAG